MNHIPRHKWPYRHMKFIAPDGEVDIWVEPGSDFTWIYRVPPEIHEYSCAEVGELRWSRDPGWQRTLSLIPPHMLERRDAA